MKPQRDHGNFGVFPVGALTYFLKTEGWKRSPLEQSMRDTIGAAISFLNASVEGGKIVLEAIENRTFPTQLPEINQYNNAKRARDLSVGTEDLGFETFASGLIDYLTAIRDGGQPEFAEGLTEETALTFWGQVERQWM